ncbi:hypothetical protein B0H14DRAFT_2692395 [Mycena olivaceomarginata]|nr:hypothetical protein B0H14DRAFT_2692395 [Mycena olivaceomarginata]
MHFPEHCCDAASHNERQLSGSQAQGRGTLHCHMLVWLEGNPTPQELRDRMRLNPEFQAAGWNLSLVVSFPLPRRSLSRRMDRCYLQKCHPGGRIRGYIKILRFNK